MTLFLDIDGILNYESHVNSETERLGFPQERSIPLRAQRVPLAHEPVKYMNYYLDKYHPDVVISSSWRLYLSETEIEQKLVDNGLHLATSSSEPGARIAGVTPVIEVGRRAEEITRYLTDNNLLPCPYIVFEDMIGSVLMTLPKQHVVFVIDGWFKKGFQFSDLEKAIIQTEKQLLNQEFPYERSTILD